MVGVGPAALADEAPRSAEAGAPAVAPPASAPLAAASPAVAPPAAAPPAAAPPAVAPTAVAPTTAASPAVAPTAGAGNSSAAPAAPRNPSAAELASARRLFALGLAAEDQGRWAEALETYERIRKIVVSPPLWYHIGVCHEALGHVVEALNAFELAQSSAVARQELALAAESRSRIEKLRTKTSQIVLRLPEDATGVRVEIDGEPIHPALVGAAILVTPGERQVSARAENYAERFEAMVRAETGAVVELRAELGRKRTPAASRPIAPVRAAPPRHPEPGPLVAPEIVVGAAAALAVGAAITGALAYDVRQLYLKKNAHPAPGSRAEREALRDRGQALALTSTALTGVALLAGGYATYLFWPSASPRPIAPRAAGRPPAPTPAAAGATALSPWVGPAGAGVAVRGSL
ncbi:hypothetical protein SOCE26_077440 [Sorangium cellulosum]|uniref:PEGA domain-containing protein n=2 Tax=Sorangium cellulosum TaxID=56 RepID=A0A2L0F465_SORCE|nr:hypothetical protein SOCE26_077440 [Sorangium cellulosum]